MAISMKKILEKYNGCEMFSLTGKITGYNITPESKEIIEKMELLNNELNVLYKEYYDESSEILSEDAENKEKELEKELSNNYYKLEEFVICYISDEEYKNALNKLEEDNKNNNELENILDDIKEEYESYNPKVIVNPIEQVPEELKKDLLYYEISFYNSITLSTTPIINYYFTLNDNTKKYLLQFRNDFYLRNSYIIEGLEDLTIYKNKEVVFSSCTHECINSLELNYKEMTIDEIKDFINDEYYNKNNDLIIGIIEKLIKLPINTKFRFKELKIDENTMQEICNICEKIQLNLLHIIDETKNEYTNATWCDLEDIIIKYN